MLLCENVEPAARDLVGLFALMRYLKTITCIPYCAVDNGACLALKSGRKAKIYGSDKIEVLTDTTRERMMYCVVYYLPTVIEVVGLV